MPKVEDRKLTPKENVMRMHKHQPQEWVPVYTMGAPIPGEVTPVAMLSPSIISKQNIPGGDGVDIWGVKWVGSDSAMGGMLPEPNNFILRDICDWRDVIKAPSLEGIDWEQMAKDDIKRTGVDRTMTAVAQDVYIGPFQMLAAFMGFTEAMIAMYEEPEEVTALLDYITDFYVEVERRYFEFAQPDVLMMADDTCAYAKPFMSEEMFKQFFVPCYKRQTQIGLEHDMPIEFHNCGKAERFIEICHDEVGITAWDPCQDSNDLQAFRQKHMDDICMLGCFDARGPLLEPDCPDELIEAEVQRVFDTYAPGGGYAFMGMFLGNLSGGKSISGADTKSAGMGGGGSTAHKNEVLLRAATRIGNFFYD